MTQAIKHTEECNYGVTSVGCPACALHEITDVVLSYHPKIKTKAAKRRLRRNKRAAKAKDKCSKCGLDLADSMHVRG